MRIRMMILVLLLMGLVGCSTAKKVYILDQAEVVRVKANQTYTTKFDGWLLSQRAVDRIMNTKISDISSQ